MLEKAKIIILTIIALLAVIVVLQNTEAVETKVLFVSFTMPRAAMLFGAIIVGFAAGVITAGRLTSKAKKEG